MLSASAPAVVAADNISVVLDGTKLSFDVPPQIINDRTMVPLRAIFEALGATVAWHQSTRTVSSDKGLTSVSLTIDSSRMTVNGKTVYLDSPACIVDDRTLVPVRAISEAYGAEVEWDGATKTVTITSAEKRKGTLNNPYLPDDVAKAAYHKYSIYDPIDIEITCTDVIRGDAGDQLATRESSINRKDNSSQEWVFFKFDITNLSSSQTLKATDLVYDDKFYTADGKKLDPYDTAGIYGENEKYNVYDCDLAPGQGGTVLYGILVDKGIDDFLLGISTNEGDDTVWMLCNDDSNTESEATQDFTAIELDYDYGPLDFINYYTTGKYWDSNCVSSLVFTDYTPYEDRYDFEYHIKGETDDDNDRTYIDIYFYNKRGTKIGEETLLYEFGSSRYDVIDEVSIDRELLEEADYIEFYSSKGTKANSNGYVEDEEEDEDDDRDSSSDVIDTAATGDLKKLVEYIVENGKTVSSTAVKLENTTNNNGITYKTSIIYHTDDDLLTFSVTAKNGDNLVGVGFDYKMSKPDATKPLSVTLLLGLGSATCTADFDIDEFSAGDELEFEVKNIGETIENAEDTANSAVTVAVDLWDELVGEAGLSLSDIGFDSY